MDHTLIAATILLCVISWQLSQSVLVDRRSRNFKSIPDRVKNTADFAQKWGYPAEEHIVKTQDDYLLTLFRIPHGIKNSTRTAKCRVPVLLQHGVFLNSDQWVLRGPHDLPFLLTELGFDVWISNTRGTRYSHHPLYTIDDYQFWNYSPDDISAFDLPALIDYVLNSTKADSLSYIGHSRGCAMAIMLLSEQPQYNKKIHLLQFLAPVIYSTYAPNPIYYLAGKRPFTLMSTSQFQLIRSGSRMGRMLSIPPVLKNLAKGMCTTGTPLDMVCPIFYFFINGEGFKNFNYTLTPMLLEHFTEGMSTKEVIHLQQISASNRFQKYDYKLKGNLRRYGQPKPPEYNISRVVVPTLIYYGPNDLFISEKDLKKFTKQLPNFRGAFKVPYARFNHIDYFWGLNTNKILFPKFLNDIQSFPHKCKKTLRLN